MPESAKKANQTKDEPGGTGWTKLDVPVLEGVQFAQHKTDTEIHGWRDRVVAVLDQSDMAILAILSIAGKDGLVFANDLMRLTDAGDAIECNIDEVYSLCRLSGLKTLVKKRVEMLFKLGALHAVKPKGDHACPVIVNAKVYSGLERRYVTPKNGR